MLKSIYIFIFWLFCSFAYSQTNYSINTGFVWDNEFIYSIGGSYIHNNIELNFIYVFPKKDTYYYENYISISNRQSIQNSKIKQPSYRFSITHNDLIHNIFFDDKSTFIGTIGYSINSYQRTTSYGDVKIGNMMFLMCGVRYKINRTYIKLLVGTDIGEEVRMSADLRIGFNILK